MIIPLSTFVLIWLVAMGIYLILAFMTIEQMFRHGSAGPMGYLSTIIFLGVATFIVANVILYVQQVDLTQVLTFSSFRLPTFTLF